MSEKKQKQKRGTILVPRYDLKKQLEYLRSFCEQVHFSGDALITLILADFIYRVEKLTVIDKQDISVAFMSFLSSSVETAENYKKLKGIIDNEKA